MDYLYKKPRISPIIANEILKQNISSIRTVEEWAQYLGMESKEFSIYYRKHYGLSCKKAMVKIRLELGCDLIMNCKDLKHHQIATRIGLADEHALYKYFKRHLGVSPLDLRKESNKNREY